MGVLAASLRPVQGMSLSPLSSAAVRLIRRQWEPRNAVPKREGGGGTECEQREEESGMLREQ